MNSCFAGSSLFINNSVKTDMAGKANGLGMTATAIARCVISLLLFAWSIYNDQRFITSCSSFIVIIIRKEALSKHSAHEQGRA